MAPDRRDLLFVVNPASRSGAAGKRWPALAAAARAAGLTADAVFTEGRGHATELVRAALGQGRRRFAVVGGDGTLNEVVNGLVNGGPADEDVELGVVAIGTGRDAIRTYGIPKRPEHAVRLLADGAAWAVDVGLASFIGLDGAPASRAFLNVASCGMTGAVAERADRTSKALGGTAAFLWATVTTFLAWRNLPLRLELDDERLELVGNNAIVANGAWFGGGMHICPRAEPDDGLFDVLVWGDVGKLDLALNLHRLYRGTHLSHPKAHVRRARRVVAASDRPLPLELDGEQPGVTPVTYQVLPRALRLIVPPRS